MKRIIFYVTLAVIVLSSCAPAATATPEPIVNNDPLGVESAGILTLSSTAFEQSGAIPEIYTCKGKNISPALSWGEPPAGTQAFALIMDDPDAPGNTWVHWVLFNIPASTRSLPEAFPKDQTLPDGSMSGNSSFGGPGYGGPCPPSGTHRYFFKLYALDEMLGLSAGANKGEVEKAMAGHILAQGELMGTFGQ